MSVITVKRVIQRARNQTSRIRRSFGGLARQSLPRVPSRARDRRLPPPTGRFHWSGKGRTDRQGTAPRIENVASRART
jgi:hypothetical protein